MSLIASAVYHLMNLLKFRQKNSERFRAELSKSNYPPRLIPADAPPALQKRYQTTCLEVMGNRVFTFTAAKNPTARVVLYFHGGAFIRKAVPIHWSFVGRWLDRFGGTMIFADYPLAPEYTCREILHFAETVYLQVAASYEPGSIILMGDSSGGGLSLALRQQIRDCKYPIPGHTILFSPWINLEMKDPEIDLLQPSDPMLPADEIRMAAKAYAGDLDITDPRVSPINGALEDLGSITLFTGTREILLPDARRIRDRFAAQGLPLNYFEYPKMIHDWMLLPLPESKQVLGDIERIITARD
jgi:acetyl esterase/lipase